ncbi:hypothetical protein [Pseudoroseicyclus tamaricis]|uniref:Lipoprotein n=1 Tax=Pseudoroseicyclus tamaricis TaxID=2705421 RepID=A0A6B2JP57_9RHOB|nr:hypothetical protein [Pseudoroseicyclus tamaricis]NDU99724.1 hypothetical protein [Pseudoroseicyclus tamaricis]
MTFPFRRALLLLPLLAAACGTVETGAVDLSFIPGIEPPTPEPPPPPPPQVVAALPAGTPDSVAFQNTDGCWLFSIEDKDPPSGFYVTDDAGQPICTPREG